MSSGRVPAADDILPVLIYVLIMVNILSTTNSNYKVFNLS